MNAISVKEIEHGVAVAEREGLGEYLYQEPVSKKCSRRSRKEKTDTPFPRKEKTDASPDTPFPQEKTEPSPDTPLPQREDGRITGHTVPAREDGRIAGHTVPAKETVSSKTYPQTLF
nr:hypothetical protein [Bacillus velezensis]